MPRFNRKGILAVLIGAIVVASLASTVPASADTWSLSIIMGASTYTVSQAEFEGMAHVTITVTDMHGTHDWSGVPLWRLAAKVDDSDPDTFNDGLAATNYSIKATSSDGTYVRCVGPTATGTAIAHNDDVILADVMDGAPLPSDTAPLKVVGLGLISSHFVSSTTSIELVYVVNVVVGSDGTITPVGNTIDRDGVVGVSFGADQAFSITPDSGYRVDTLTVDNIPASPASSYVFKSVAANHTIDATFAFAATWDLNVDHICNIGDVVKVGLKWGQTGSAGWIPEDLNNDGVINIGDVVVVGLHWGEIW